jgi:hypothetical protein
MYRYTCSIFIWSRELNPGDLEKWHIVWTMVRQRLNFTDDSPKAQGALLRRRSLTTLLAPFGPAKWAEKWTSVSPCLDGIAQLIRPFGRGARAVERLQIHQQAELEHLHLHRALLQLRDPALPLRAVPPLLQFVSKTWKQIIIF